MTSSDHNKHPPAAECCFYLGLKYPPVPLKPPTPLPSSSELLSETKSLLRLASPIALTTLIHYTRSMLSMLFLGRLGQAHLAAGSLAIAFANITGYSVLSGLSLGMEPLCSQAFGANRHALLSLTLYRAFLFLLLCSVPISLLWLNSHRLLIALGQDSDISALARTYLAFSLPDLLAHSLLNPLRIYLRSQGITRPLTVASLAGAALHLPAAFLLVSKLRLGAAGVAAAAAASNLAALAALVLYIRARGLHGMWPLGRECLSGWGPLVRLAGPSCASVCLEWWWYEIMIVMSGLLPGGQRVAVAAMGVLIQTTSLLYVLPSSVGAAAAARVGNELGANRPGRARACAAAAVGLAAGIGCGAVGFTASVRCVWARMYTDDEGVGRLAAAALPILGLCELGNCPQTVGCGVVRGTARPAAAANVNLGAFYLVGMPVAVGLGFGLGVGFRGLWLGLLAAQVCCAGMMLYVVGTTNWEYQAVRAQLLTCGPRSGEKAESPATDENDNQPLICDMVNLHDDE
ncbi:MATE efflux family protein [Striga hermonthica]|uniref:Protein DETOXIFICATION n=1 Tax=Striga hermonthica TaxID=68872 RepID=A0A9N7MVZ7_STRHE|nr:MATE efflux family protein [Striga hermonthica]